MTCRDVDRALIENLPLAREIEEHSISCARCRQLVNAQTSAPKLEVPNPEIVRQLQQRLAADLQPVRPIASRRYFLAAIATVFVLVVALGAFRLGVYGIPAMTPLQCVAALGALAAAAGILAYSLVQQMVPGSHHWVPPNVLPAAILVALLTVMACVFEVQHERHFWEQGWSCLRAGTPYGLLAAVPLWLLLRRGVILSLPVTGTAAGLLAGLVGTTALELHCPVLDVAHIMLWHLGVALLGAVLGFAAGSAAEVVAKNRSRNQ